MTTTRVQVEIAGMTFHVIGEDDETYVKALANEANECIQEVESHNYRLNDVQVYILSLLNALDEKNKQARAQEAADALAGDSQGVKEKLEEIDALNKRLKENSKTLEAKDKKIKELDARFKESDDEKKKLEREKAALSEEKAAAEAQLKARDEKIRELEEKNYETQMRLVDLNKEIYVLRGDHEQE